MHFFSVLGEVFYGEKCWIEILFYDKHFKTGTVFNQSYVATSVGDDSLTHNYFTIFIDRLFYISVQFETQAFRSLGQNDNESCVAIVH